MSIPVFRTYIRRKDMDTVLNCLVTDSVGPGEYLDRFQRSAREAFGFDYGFAVRSPLIGPRARPRFPGLDRGGRGGPAGPRPGLLFRGPRLETAEAGIRRLPPDTAEPDLARIDTLEPRPKAFVLHDALGILPDPEAVAAVGATVIEDMSKAIGAYRGESRAGSLGKIAFFGLEHDSLVTSGGGALLCDLREEGRPGPSQPGERR